MSHTSQLCHFNVGQRLELFIFSPDLSPRDIYNHIANSIQTFSNCCFPIKLFPLSVIVSRQFSTRPFFHQDITNQSIFPSGRFSTNQFSLHDVFLAKLFCHLEDCTLCRFLSWCCPTIHFTTLRFFNLRGDIGKMGRIHTKHSLVEKNMAAEIKSITYLLISWWRR